jgi:hypothetical protein
MKLNKYTNEQGALRYFSVNNLLVSRSGLCRMIASCEGVTITKKPRFFDDDVFCEFTINGHRFYVEEPFGDNATYDFVAPESGSAEMQQLAKHLETMSPVTGGDFGHQLYFLFIFITGGLFMLVIFKAILELFFQTD